MKKLITILIIITIAWSFNSARSHNLFLYDLCPDILIDKLDLTINPPKLCVGDNGWIYVLHNVFAQSCLYISLDEGKTFSAAIELKATAGWEIREADMIVTGSGENTAVWIATVFFSSDNEGGKIRIDKYDADGKNPVNKYEQILGDAYFTSVSIATDYCDHRTTGSPFCIGVASATSRKAADDNKCFIEYLYSTDEGNSFKAIGSIASNNTVKDYFWAINLALGTKYVGGPTMAALAFNVIDDDTKLAFVIAEANKNVPWPAYEKLYKIDSYSRIQWAHSVRGDNFHFLIAYKDNLENINVLSPKETFTATNFGVANFNKVLIEDNSFDPDIAFDKATKNYHLTYIANPDGSSKYINRYKTRHYQADIGTWEKQEAYSTTETGDNFFPAIDIHPTHNQPCYTWLHSDGEPSLELYFDSQWATLDVEDKCIATNSISVSPNPATDKTNIVMPHKTQYSVALYDMQGKQIMEFKFTGNKHTLNLNNLNSGVYMLKLSSDNKTYSSKIVKK